MHNYGYIPDIPDQRDLLYKEELGAVPPAVDLRVYCPPVYDQGQLGSCTANAVAGAIEYDQIKESIPESTPSRLFIYYNERVIENSVASDAGAAIRDGIKTVHQQGACDEIDWPYDIGKFTSLPPDTCYTQADTHLVTKYHRINRTLKSMQSCLASAYPFIFGFTVYESFESDEVASTGVVPMPGKNEQVLGGHAVLCVGYDNSTQRFLVRNSWGTSWGQTGYFTIPYAYLLNRQLASDYWAINITE